MATHIKSGQAITANGNYTISIPNLGNSRVALGLNYTSGTGTLVASWVYPEGNQAIPGASFTSSSAVELIGSGATAININVTSASSLSVTPRLTAIN